MVPGAADLLAALDFTPHLLNDMHAPMVTVILEEQALAPARLLARVPSLEHLLGLVQQGCEPAQLPAGLPLKWQAPGCLGPRLWLFGGRSC